MKEVCIVNYASNAANYGIGTYIKEYVRCLLRMGCKVTQVELGADRQNAEVDITVKGNVRTIHIPYICNSHIMTYNQSVCRILRLYMEDSSELIFHFHYMQSSSLLSNIEKYFPLAKSALTVHYLQWSSKFNGNLATFENIIKKSHYENIKKKYQGVITAYQDEKEFMSRVDAVVCLSNDTYRQLHGLYELDESKLFLIPNGLTPKKHRYSIEEQNEIRKKYLIEADEKIILFVGRIHPIKGIEPLLSCFSRVVDSYPKCRLILIGDGEINDSIKKIQHVFTRITFIGRLDRKSLYEWYQIAEIAVFPSFYEECSYVGIEMLMHGIPIVASDGYNVKNMFTENNAVIAPINDWDNLSLYESHIANGILALLVSGELSRIKRQQALNAYNQTYQLGDMQKKYASMFRRFELK